MKFNRLRICSNNRNASMSYNSDPFLIKHCIKPAHFTETQLGQLGVIFRWSVQTGLSTAGRIMLHFPSPLREELKWLVLSDMWGVLCAGFEVLKKFITLACVIAYMCQTTHTHTSTSTSTHRHNGAKMRMNEHAAVILQFSSLHWSRVCDSKRPAILEY